jgi:DNA-binding transcriptional regulator YiaG
MLMAKKRKKKPAGSNPWPATLGSLRAHYGISQEEAAGRIDCPLGTWRNWEQGRRVPNAMIQRLIRLTFPEFFGKKS